MSLLISPDGGEEALDRAKAAEHLDIVDVRKSDEGSLSANFPWVIREIGNAVPADKPVSATVGDVPYKPGTVAQTALGVVVSGPRTSMSVSTDTRRPNRASRSCARWSGR
ncbi:hypothetical protein GCM10010279_29570 [Streptomyces mutabilis]|nr:hypothetical protein GCM10010279_29570 [Streptomyces mutabilis]